MNLTFDYTNDDPETFTHTNDAWNVQMMPNYTESIVQTLFSCTQNDPLHILNVQMMPEYTVTNVNVHKKYEQNL